MEGRTLERVKVLDERWCRPLAPGEMTDALEGRKVEKLGRRGKYLLWGLSEEVYLAQHLRMTGADVASLNVSLAKLADLVAAAHAAQPQSSIAA